MSTRKASRRESAPMKSTKMDKPATLNSKPATLLLQLDGDQTRMLDRCVEEATRSALASSVSGPTPSQDDLDKAVEIAKLRGRAAADRFLRKRSRVSLPSRTSVGLRILVEALIKREHVFQQSQSK